jgi:CHRD domain
MRRRVLTLLTLPVALWLVTLGLPAAASAHGAHGGQPPVLLAAGLRGANEVPGPGDPDGRARALVRLEGDQVCFAVFWKGLDPVIAAHIHKGRRGEAGPIVIGFFATSADLATAPGLPAELHAVAGCTTGDPATVADVRAHPRDYYVNIHTTVYRAGAVRGQLHRLV